jgi:hypothetical protein
MTVSPDTLVDYRWQLEHYVIPHVDHIRLTKLTPADVQKMLRSLEAGYSPRTRQYARAILRRALSWAEGTGGILLRNAVVEVTGRFVDCHGSTLGEPVLDRIPAPRSRCRSGVRQNAPQLEARLDLEFPIHLSEVVINRAGADEQPLRDLGVGQAAGCEACDL